MTQELYVYVIVALLPLTACMLVFQVNPYHALVIRGILGAVAALVYALLGAADVALTEALVGTMLSITLYAVAVRSSMSLRLGVLEQPPHKMSKDGLAPTDVPEHTLLAGPLRNDLRQVLNRYHMRLEVVPYPHPQAMQAALEAKDIHAVCTVLDSGTLPASSAWDEPSSYHLQIRVQRLYTLLQAGLPLNGVKLSHITPATLGQSDISQSSVGPFDPVEMQS
ncbi:MAG: DUF4040 domain-containing protein [Cyanobacteria bacterium P01_F01_bin.86]